MLKKNLMAAGLLLATAQSSIAADWQYCIAPSHDKHMIYISPPFPTRGSARDADTAFDSMLDKKGLLHDDVQCPRADDEVSIATMRQYTIKFNQETGTAIVGLPLENMR